MPDHQRHPALVAFLADVDARLHRLPAERRISERDELAQHLELLVAAYRLRGLDEEEAVRAAIVRFGRAEQIGAALHDAWRRTGKTGEYVRFFAAYAAFIVGSYLALFWSMGDPLPPHLPWVIALNALVLPSVFIYVDVRKRRRDAWPEV